MTALPSKYSIGFHTAAEEEEDQKTTPGSKTRRRCGQRDTNTAGW